LGNACAGAPFTPANTWFQTALLHVPTVLLRTRNCCCEPFSTKPGMAVSAMKPPLAKDGAVQKSISVKKPFSIFTRRIGAACEVAQKSPAASQPVFLLVFMSIVRFDSERQKFTSAVQSFGPKHWLWTSIVPVTATSSGDAPSPATSV
jgi:hypothetical protein